MSALEASCAALVALESIYVWMLASERGDPTHKRQLTLAIESLSAAIDELRSVLGPETSAVALGFVAEAVGPAPGSRAAGRSA